MEGSELRQIRVVNNDISFGKTQQDEETVHNYKLIKACQICFLMCQA